MNKPNDAFSILYDRILNCSDCVPEVFAKLKEPKPEGYKFCWEPLRYGERPFAYIFFGMEPTMPREDQLNRGRFPRPGIFHEALLFAIKTFVLKNDLNKSFMITNTAKCSMPSNPLCKKTRPARFQACAIHLVEELKISTTIESRSQLVGIGQDVTDFLKSLQKRSRLPHGLNSQTIHNIWHYSYGPIETHYKKYSNSRAHAFDDFCKAIEPEYCKFVYQDKGSPIVPPEYVDEFKIYDREKDLRRLFKWSEQIRGWQ